MPHHDSVRRRCRVLLLGGSLLLGGWLAAGQAQVTTTITPDGTLKTTVTQRGPVYDITGGTRPGHGPNLFHSFGAFSVGTGDTARFDGPSGVANILARVTGGQLSSIDGRLQSESPGVNLFLLNPSGVLFGPNASLNVKESFHVSTADYLRLADGGQFFAHLGQDSGLTVAPPAAFGFLGPQPGPLTIQGSRLEVPDGRALSFVGGDITIVGRGSAESRPTLRAPGGRIQLASVASPGEAIFSPLEMAPDLQLDHFARFGRIALSDGAWIRVDRTGTRDAGAIALRGGHVTFTGGSRLSAITSGQGQGGTIDVHADQVTLAEGAAITAATNGEGRGGTVTVTASEAVVITGQDSAGNPSRVTVAAFQDSGGDAGRVVIAAPAVKLMDRGVIQAGAFEKSRGHAGTIEVQVGTLTLEGGAGIFAATQGEGRGGTVTITASEAVVITGQDSAGNPSRATARTTSGGDAGRIVVAAPTVRLTERGLIQAETSGGATGQGGVIDIRAGTLRLTRGGRISVRTIGGSGSAGTITITAREAVVIEERFSIRRGDNSMVESTTDNGSGDAGRIVIFAPSVRVTDEGAIDARALSNSRGQGGTIELEVGRLTLAAGGTINIASAGTRAGGRITVHATDTIIIGGPSVRGVGGAIGGNRSGLLSESVAPVRGGDIEVVARHIQLHDGGTISTNSGGDGAAGSIVIRAGETFLSRRGVVRTQTRGSAGGTVELRAGKLVALSESELSTSVQGGESDAGNLTLTALVLVVENSTISANAFGGKGGNIRIETEAFLADPATQVSASSMRNVPGTVEIQAPVTNLNVVVTPLAAEFAPATALLRDRCTARLQAGVVSSLVERNRDGVPASPDGVLPSRLSSGRAGMASPMSEIAGSRPGGSRLDRKGRLQSRRPRASIDVAPAQEPECAAR